MILRGAFTGNKFRVQVARVPLPVAHCAACSTMLIKDHTFIVTGGASGLGEAVVRRLHADGANVIVGDMSEDSGKALQSELGSRVCFVKCNVTDEASVQSALSTGLSRFGNQLHGVINCAGVGSPKKVLNKGGVHDLKTFKFVIDVNLIGTFNVLRLSADIMAKQALNGGERGVIINVASVAAFEGQIGQASYSASKAGVVGMTLPIARELAEHGIRVLTVAPGLFETPMLARLPDKARASLAAQVPFPRRLGQPSEFASLVAHLISNQYLNAECVRIDGAIRMAAM